MKRLLYLALLSLIMVGCRNGEERIFLTDWHFDYNDLQRYTATVPSFIHTDLMANGLIPDPYYGTNEDSTRWVEDKVWSYRYHINRNNLPKGDTLWLVFEGIAGRLKAVVPPLQLDAHHFDGDDGIIYQKPQGNDQGTQRNQTPSYQNSMILSSDHPHSCLLKAIAACSLENLLQTE